MIGTQTISIRLSPEETLTDCQLPTGDTKGIRVTALYRYGLNGPHAPSRELIIKLRRVEMPKRKLTDKEEKAFDDELDFELEKIRQAETELVPPLTVEAPQKEVDKLKKLKTPKKGNAMKRKPVLTAVVITAIVTLGLVFAGFKTYQYIYNLGVQSEIDRQANITAEVVKSVEQLKP